MFDDGSTGDDPMEAASSIADSRQATRADSISSLGELSDLDDGNGSTDEFTENGTAAGRITGTLSPEEEARRLETLLARNGGPIIRRSLDGKLEPLKQRELRRPQRESFRSMLWKLATGSSNSSGGSSVRKRRHASYGPRPRPRRASSTVSCPRSLTFVPWRRSVRVCQ